MKAKRSSATWSEHDMVTITRKRAAVANEAMGFFTDTTVCIGCKACEVACKNWNQLPSTHGGVSEMSGDSYDNTRKLDGIHWRHVRFIEQFKGPYDGRWLMMSDVCKHCVQAGCLEVCPTGAIIRTEFDTVVIQSDVCNGCRACIAACPFGVIDINPVSGTAQKCTLCYDRLKVGLEPACSKACPTDSIQFGSIAEVRTRAHKRVDQLKAQGVKAELYGGAPHWTWFIIPYFFVGGLAGGAYFLAALLEWFGRPDDRPVIRTGYRVAAVGAILSGLLLTIDLGRPLRFWHMLFQSANFPAIMFKGWSPISFGAWGVLLFGLFSVLAALGGMAEQGRLHNPTLRAVGGAVHGGVAKLVGGVAGLFGLFIAGSTGGLLSSANPPNSAA